jgi:hypothetical protein
MFKWLNKQGVESDKGFIVQVVSRFEIEYRQQSKKISVIIEIESVSSTRLSIVVLKSSFRCWSNGVQIAESEQEKIIKNFIDAMNFQDIDVIVEN